LGNGVFNGAASVGSSFLIGGMGSGMGGGFGGGGGGVGGGGGGEVVVRLINNSFLGGGGGGGGSVIDSSATMFMTEVSGVASPDDSPNGEIIITEISDVPEPATMALVGLGGLCVGLFRRWRK
jgi:hypothetical protein